MKWFMDFLTFWNLWLAAVIAALSALIGAFWLGQIIWDIFGLLGVGVYATVLSGAGVSLWVSAAESEDWR